MEFGERYLIKYQIPGVHKVPRYGLAKVIGVENNKYILSGRPEFGTTEVEKAWLIEATFVPANDTRKCFMDSKTPR